MYVKVMSEHKKAKLHFYSIVNIFSQAHLNL